MQALKIIGILIMLSVLAATAYAFPRFGTEEVPMSFQDYVRYAVPAFCLGAAMMGIERLTSKIIIAQANKPAKKEEPKKDAPKKDAPAKDAPKKDAPKKEDKPAAGKAKK